MSMSNSFSKAMTSSTVSRLSAPRSSMKLASDVSLSRSTPSSSTMMSLTFSSSCFISIAMGILNRGMGNGSQHHPAVDDQQLPRNVAGEVGGEKEHGGGDILPLPQPAQWDGLDQGLPRLRADPAGQFGVDEPGRHGVHQHVARGELFGDLLGEPDQSRLGRRVVRLTLVPGHPDDAGYVDDPAPPPLHDPPRGVLGRQERALQVRVEHRVPVVLTDTEQQVVARGARVVDEHVDPVELLLDGRDDPLDLRGLGDIAVVAAPAAVAQRLRRLPRLRPVPAQQRHLGPRTGQGLSDREADATAAARYQGDLVGEIDLHAASKKRATSSALPRDTTLAPGTMRFNKPASTFPGPTSMKRASPPASSTARCMDATQRTGVVNWSPSRRRARPASRTGSALVLAIT